MTTTHYISAEKTKLDIDLIHSYLSERSYWAKGRARQEVEISIENSLCFGIYNEQDQMVGFARVVTDRIIFAYLMDVFILEEYRGRGLGKMLMNNIMKSSELKQIKKWLLATADAQGLYQKYGFTPLAHPEILMEKKNI